MGIGRGQLRDPASVGAVLRIVLERAQAGSTPSSRCDDHLVCLAVEGGGMRGAVSAGMCVVLEAAGLVPGFDRIYGVSAGALNGCATAFGQAALGATYYQDAVRHRVINRMRPLRGRPVIDLDLLFDDLIAARKPLSLDASRSGPEFRALATSLETMSVRVLRDFADAQETMLAVRASAALPRLGGAPPTFRGEQMSDGGLVEPIPVQTPQDEGATHLLVLRSRSAAYRRRAVDELSETLLARDDPRLAGLLKSRRGAYNRVAARLEQATTERTVVEQITVPDGARLVGRLQNSDDGVVDALRTGARAMASAILTTPVDLCWQPAVHLGGLDAAPAPQPSRTLSVRRRAAAPDAAAA